MVGSQTISYSRTPSSATLTLTDPNASRDAAAVRAAKLVVSRAQGEYEALEKEREAEEAGLGSGKRVQEDANGDGGRGGKRMKVEADEDEEMEMEVEDDDDGALLIPDPGIKAHLNVDAPAGNAGSSGSRLIATNLPPECTEDIMSALFSQCV
jgi:hypothetical protein